MVKFPWIQKQKFKVFSLIQIEGQRVQIVLDQTSFYGESGGQVGDNGIICTIDAEVIVDKVVRKKNVFLHYGRNSEKWNIYCWTNS